MPKVKMCFESDNEPRFYDVVIIETNVREYSDLIALFAGEDAARQAANEPMTRVKIINEENPYTNGSIQLVDPNDIVF
jgi:hypothetical protein